MSRLRAELLATWRRNIAVLLLCLVVGASVGLLLPMRYTAQAKLIAGTTSVDIAAVPAYAEAGKSLAETYSRIFLGDAVRDTIREAGKSEVTVGGNGISWAEPDGDSVSVGASPIAGSSLVMIEANAGTEATAEAAADLAAGALVRTVEQVTTTEEARRQAESDLSRALAALAERERLSNGDAGSTAELQAARAAADAHRDSLDAVIQNATRANSLDLLASAGITSSNLTVRPQWTGLLGAALGAGLVLALAARGLLVRGSGAAAAAEEVSPRVTRPSTAAVPVLAGSPPGTGVPRPAAARGTTTGAPYEAAPARPAGPPGGASRTQPPTWPPAPFPRTPSRPEPSRERPEHPLPTGEVADVPPASGPPADLVDETARDRRPEEGDHGDDPADGEEPVTDADRTEVACAGVLHPIGGDAEITLVPDDVAGSSRNGRPA
ncbi:hypothetical protein [Pseudonocardia alni]|uniref:hypothetical protein n=1 Tax=Pseudonocardia alni TaxID=33907 RepID=UPI00279C3A8C|nr:hypothetical protein PaSha_17385 [Pseudonocardia alni]